MALLRVQIGNLGLQAAIGRLPRRAYGPTWIFRTPPFCATIAILYGTAYRPSPGARSDDMIPPYPAIMVSGYQSIMIACFGSLSTSNAGERPMNDSTHPGGMGPIPDRICAASA